MEKLHIMCNLFERQLQIIDGLMLGDGTLERRKPTHNASLKVHRCLRDISYRNWLAKELSSLLTPKSCYENEIFDKRTNRKYYHASFRSKCCPCLTPIYDRWYPNGIKSIPSDLKLNPLTLAVWFADDGSLYNPTNYALDIKFATHGFTAADAERLKDILQDYTRREFRVYYEKGQPTIRGFSDASRAVLRIIDDVFPSLDRKSEIWRANNYRLFHGKPIKPVCPRCTIGKVYSYGRTRKGVQKFKCVSCMHAFQSQYERSMHNVYYPTLSRP